MPPRPTCRPDIVRRQIVIEAFRLSPDGERVVYVRRQVEGSAYRSHLWGLPYTGGRASRLTSGALRDSSPSFSPDGSRLAFVRTPEGADHGQAWILPFEGGEPWQLTELAHGVSSVKWSPDGRLIALLAPSDDLPFIQGLQRTGKAPLVRRITRLDWRDDEEGHRDRRSHLFLVEPRPGARPRQLTRGDRDVEHPVWAPDARSIAFVADPRPDADIDPHLSIWSVDVRGGEPREIVALRGDAAYPAFSPDGSRLAFLGRDVPEPADYEPWPVWLANADGSSPRALIADRDVAVGAWAWSDLVLCQDAPGPVWLDDESVACITAAKARCWPSRLTVDGEGNPQPMTSEDRLVTSAIDVRAGRAVICAAIGMRAAELYAVEEGRLRQLTRDGSGWQRRCPVPTLEELDIPGPLGPINTWLVSPADAGEDPLPLILNFHGGPAGSAGAGGSLDAMILTSAGYRVAMPNMRGSTTYGYDWAAALDGRWGEVDAEDVHAVVDQLVRRGLAEKGRIGAFGYSYAGFLVQWLSATTDLLAAAVAESGVANQVSAWGNCFFGVYWNRRHNLGEPLTEQGMLRMWRRSPMAYASQISTPLLILQAEEDRVCPPADNEQLFTALRVLGRTTEYILYPEEHHEMKNYGRPDRRIDRHERILDWFGRYLK